MFLCLIISKMLTIIIDNSVNNLKVILYITMQNNMNVIKEKAKEAAIVKKLYSNFFNSSLKLLITIKKQPNH